MWYRSKHSESRTAAQTVTFYRKPQGFCTITYLVIYRLSFVLFWGPLDDWFIFKEMLKHYYENSFIFKLGVKSQRRLKNVFNEKCCWTDIEFSLKFYPRQVAQNVLKKNIMET